MELVRLVMGQKLMAWLHVVVPTHLDGIKRPSAGVLFTLKVTLPHPSLLRGNLNNQHHVSITETAINGWNEVLSWGSPICGQLPLSVDMANDGPATLIEDTIGCFNLRCI